MDTKGWVFPDLRRVFPGRVTFYLRCRVPVRDRHRTGVGRCEAVMTVSVGSLSPVSPSHTTPFTFQSTYDPHFPATCNSPLSVGRRPVRPEVGYPFFTDLHPLLMWRRLSSTGSLVVSVRLVPRCWVPPRPGKRG